MVAVCSSIEPANLLLDAHALCNINLLGCCHARFSWRGLIGFFLESLSEINFRYASNRWHTLFQD